MKFVLRMVLAVAFAAAVAGSALAQRPGGGGGIGFGFGGGSVYGMVGTNKVLQEELKISDDQKKKVEEALKPIAEKRTEAMRGGFNRDATDEQRKEMREKMEKLSDETKKAVEGALDDKQKARLSEINVQYMGFNAFSNKDVQEKLKLTDAQKEKVKSVAEGYQKDAAELRKDMPMRTQGQRQQSEEDMKKMADYRKKADALRSEAEDKVKAELTADQKGTWKTLVGEKFDTTKLQQGFGGQGGNRGGNRPRTNN